MLLEKHGGIHIDPVTSKGHRRRRDSTSFRCELARSRTKQVLAPPRIRLKELRHVELESPRIIEATGTRDWPFLLPVVYPPDAPSSQANDNEQETEENPPCGHDRLNFV
jgi:hypothetical protein